ncbi:Putative nuclease [Frankliniella fusca]|uniref:Nuclease n=1 Tax=Frankliniella fusca TaxID=407009 RepID=A0AAE1LBV2_9NEOP|nr:Putative nuclease [Frankliniella fusca]
MAEIDDEEEVLELIVLAVMLEFGLDDDLGRPFNAGVAKSLQNLVNKESWRRLHDPYFAKHFRMDTTTFERPLLALGNHLVATNKIIRRPTEPLYFSLLMVLWILAAPDTFRAVAVKFGVAQSIVHFHYLHVYVGQPGSVGDARTFQRRPLGRSILRNQDTCYDKHLLGDGAYKLTSQVMAPYRNRGILTQKQRTHNYYLSKTRSHVERAFALLKKKWRRLKPFHNYCLTYAIDHITACIVLHNFVLLEGEKYEGVAVDHLHGAPDINEEQVRQAAADGELKRDFIADLLYGGEE